MPITKYALPEIIFGPATFDHTALCARQLGASRVLLVSDSGIEDAGWVQRIMDLLAADGLTWTYFNDCVPNPRDFSVAEGARRYREEHADVIIALGGGSVIDTAKGIAAVVGNGGKIRDYEGANKMQRPLPPMLCLPTTAGSGSDISQFCIITDMQRQLKMSIISRTLTPNVSIIDPLLTHTKTRELIVASAIDAMAHAVESYLSVLASPFTEVLALEAISRIVHSLPAAAEDRSPVAMEQLCIASTQAGMSFSNAGLGIGHSLAHALGGVYDVIHGDVHPVVLPVVMEYNLPNCVDKLAAIGERIPGAARKTPEATARAGIDFLREFFTSLGADTQLSRILPENVHQADWPTVAAAALQDACTLTNPRTPTQEDLLRICREVW